MDRKERTSLTPSHLNCSDNMVIVTHAVSWAADACSTQPESMQAIQRTCDGKSYCYVQHSRSALGDPCPGARLLRFTMYFSCQTGKIQLYQ